jgi:Flp pilus assembly pilin Flp
MEPIANFLRREDGAITVDWVVLSAAIIGLGMVVLIPIAYSTESSTQQIADGIENQPVGYGNN